MKERVPICQEKEKNFLCESDWCWRSSTLAFRVWIKKSPSNQNLPYTMLKTRFPFLYASTSLDAKTFVYKTLASNRNFESCMSIRCLAPQYILQFFPFLSRVFLCIGNFAHHCVVLLTLHLAIEIKKKTCLQWDFFPGNLGPKSVTLGGPVVLLACGSRGRDNLLAWGKLFASPYELKSRIWVWEEYNQFERCYRVCRLDRFLSNFA